MAKNSRAVAQTEKARISAKRGALEERVELLERRRALTASEELELKQLKKEKLAAKDRLSSLGD